MGGDGSSGRKVRSAKLKELAEKAKGAIREASEPKKRNVFISFASEDLDEVNLLRGQAKNKLTDLEFNDRSLFEPFDSKKAEYIKRGIRERIKQASVTLCYLTGSSSRSKWVDWEIRESLRQGKAVIGVFQGSKPPEDIPEAAKKARIPIVPWRHKDIMEAIDEASSGRRV